jgi:hypothetical protein
MHIRFSNFDNVGLGFRRFTSAHHKSTRQSFSKQILRTAFNEQKISFAPVAGLFATLAASSPDPQGN